MTEILEINETGKVYIYKGKLFYFEKDNKIFIYNNKIYQTQTNVKKQIDEDANDAFKEINEIRKEINEIQFNRDEERDKSFNEINDLLTKNLSLQREKQALIMLNIDLKEQLKNANSRRKGWFKK